MKSPSSYTMHQSSPPVLNDQLACSQGLTLWFIVHIWLGVCYNFSIFVIWLFLLLRNTGIGLMLLCNDSLTCIATVTVMTTTLAESLNANWQQLFHCLITCWAVTSIYLTWQLFFCCGPSSSITQQETSVLFSHLPCCVVFGTLHS